MSINTSNRMKTRIKKEGDTIIVNVDGKLNYEGQLPLKEDLTKIISNNMTDTTPKKIIFNLEKLEFVGSSGISSFVQTLKEFNQRSPSKPAYCNVRSEFQKIIRAFDEENAFDFFESEEKARSSFDH